MNYSDKAKLCLKLVVNHQIKKTRALKGLLKLHQTVRVKHKVKSIPASIKCCFVWQALHDGTV